MKKRLQMTATMALSLMLLLCAASGPSQDVASPKRPEFLLKLLEHEFDMKADGGIAPDCLLVLPTGAFQLERRIQRFPATSVNLVLYEGQLNGRDLDALKGLINEKELAALPSFEYRRPPGNLYELHSLVAQIARDRGVQKVGYYRWQSNDPQDSLDLAPAGMKSTLESEASTLQPLSE